MGKTIALDSSLLIAFKIQNDVHHERANILMNGIASERFGRPFITDYLFDETVSAIMVRSRKLELAVGYGKELLNSLEMFDVDKEVFRKAWQIFSEQKRTRLSFTDATTIAAMNAYGVKQLATFDKYFEGVEGIKVVGLREKLQ